MIPNKPREDNTAPFNMAIARLMSLSKTLDDVRDIYSHPEIPNEHKQQLKINLLRKFYIDASALLKEDVVEKHKAILDLKPKTIPIINSSYGTSTRVQGKKVIFDFELEKELDNYFIKIQRELSSKGIFMPPKNDPKFAWRQD